jgi:hypothetical protein
MRPSVDIFANPMGDHNKFRPVAQIFMQFACHNEKSQARLNQALEIKVEKHFNGRRYRKARLVKVTRNVNRLKKCQPAEQLSTTRCQ